MLDADLQNNKAVFPDTDSLKNCEVFQYLGTDVDSIYNEYWKEVEIELGSHRLRMTVPTAVRRTHRGKRIRNTITAGGRYHHSPV